MQTVIMPSLSHAIVHGTSKHVKNWTLMSLLSQPKQYRLDITAQRKRWEGIVWRNTSQILGIREWRTRAEYREEWWDE